MNPIYGVSIVKFPLPLPQHDQPDFHPLTLTFAGAFPCLSAGSSILPSPQWFETILTFTPAVFICLHKSHMPYNQPVPIYVIMYSFLVVVLTLLLQAWEDQQILRQCKCCTQMMKAMVVEEHVVALLIVLTGLRNLADLCWTLTDSVADVDLLMIWSTMYMYSQGFLWLLEWFQESQCCILLLSSIESVIQQ